MSACTELALSLSPLPPPKRTEKKVACHLSIQTQANLFHANRQVKCVVVSSLLTTQRRFRALLLFRRSPLYKPILSPSCNYFRPCDPNAVTRNAVSMPSAALMAPCGLRWPGYPEPSGCVFANGACATS